MDYIKIRLESELCAASGESSGNAVDSDICINSYGLPYIPARRIKGCLRASAAELMDMGAYYATVENIDALFGNPFGQEGALQIMDGNMKGIESLNEYLYTVRHDNNLNILKNAAHPVNIINIFSDVMGQTKMQNGVKLDNTLRFTRVLKQYDPLTVWDNKTKEPSKLEFLAPITLECLSDNMKDKENEIRKLLDASCKALRHIGLNRTRGLGNITVELIQENDENVPEAGRKLEAELKNLVCDRADTIEIPYHIVLNAPVSIPGIAEYETEIPGRSVIGCMAGTYLKDHNADETFKNLFLNGKVIWSPLTPVIGGKISHPTPMMLMELKNGGKKKINRYTQAGNHWSSQKPKTLDGTYAVATEEGFIISDPLLQMSYHHSISKDKLYAQNALENTMIYGGNVLITDADKNLASEVIKLLQNGKIRFGRSKGAQYAACSLKDFGTPGTLNTSPKQIQNKELLFVVLQTDMVLIDNGVYRQDSISVRKAIVKKLNETEQSGICLDKSGNPVHPEGYIDICQYKTLSGYQTMWHLQKPHIPAIKAGSVYCFVSDGGVVPEYVTVGEYIQEGCGRCCVFTLSNLNKMQNIQKGSIDINTPVDKSDRKKQLETAMLIYTAKEVLRRYAREYIVKERNIPISRLRLMLSEAASYKDLLKRVDNMKTSDKSSVNEKGKKTISQELLYDFYGSSDKPVLKKILCNEPNLYQSLEKDSNAMQEVLKMWKLPLDILLHNMHYKKGR